MAAAPAAPAAAESHYFVGVDIGTGSARAGVSDDKGQLLATYVQKIQTWNLKADYYEQSSADIWSAVCTCVKAALARAGVKAAAVKGIGFDATCSLVVLDATDKPVTVSPVTRDDQQNIIVWMDHRAKDETNGINGTRHGILKYVGGTISPEMELPKLLWLKTHMPDTWKRAARFLDLADFLAYRATGCDTRSLCTITCKWTYQPHVASVSGKPTDGWNAEFLKLIGLEDLCADNFARIGRTMSPVGVATGSGLTAAAAAELGLAPGTAVATGIIDAHSGGIGMLGAALPVSSGLADCKLENRLALICGTSSCHMASASTATFVPGVWGPYLNAMIPGLWLLEGGQSATGALIDHVVRGHAAFKLATEQAHKLAVSEFDVLAQTLEAMAKARALPHTALLTKSVHVLPYFHGNRSPRADPSLLGTVTGLTLGGGLEELAVLYLATVQAIAYGTRHIVETMRGSGMDVRVVFACGGLSKSPLFVREHADATGCAVVLPREPDAVIMGSCVLAAAASGRFASVADAMTAMNHAAAIVKPVAAADAKSVDAVVHAFHSAKYKVFLKMYADQMEYRKLMAEADAPVPAAAATAAAAATTVAAAAGAKDAKAHAKADTK